MEKWYSSEKVRALDAKLIASGTPSLDLMETAGTGIVEKTLREYGQIESALICAGSGNNGGDGFVIARLLADMGTECAVLLAKAPEASKGDARVNLDKLRNRTDIIIHESAKLADDEIEKLINAHAVTFDALLGTGAKGAPRGETLRLINLINARTGGKAIAVDVPSGAESGDACVKADLTCTIGGRKTEISTGRAAALAGKIEYVSLGDGTEKHIGTPDMLCPEKSDIAALLPERRPDDHKGKRGGVLIVAGSNRYRGAALLAAQAAFRAGAGLVVLASCRPVLDALAYRLPEAICEELETPHRLTDVIARWGKRCTALLIGPGLDRDARAQELCAKAAAEWENPSVWDGDALYFLARDILSPRDPCITPHEGEAARLLGAKTIENRISAVKTLAEKHGAAILKGYRSLVMSRGDAVPTLITAGDRTLSVAGSGDVLAGTAAAFLAAGLGNSDALTLAAWCHGTAGELLGKERGRDGVLAHEIADGLPAVVKSLTAETRDA